ncbi:sulfate adenylyltransferase [Heyndrickxia acidicola]|uniref:Sulfate adenylyltransferase n=1 Tax=Heyndrickxia acidicola TaxID=209389 RepID=A0ABU6MFJ3_9BACI|nr:sulfate adenylyltransferase [Heyndrickxia acidicola]MED1203449.1 sulfate adenylyltransferase [Heyndrickxia acidicola]
MTISPHGGKLINAYDPSYSINPLHASLEIDAFTLANLECIANGAYSPINGFMSKGDYESVLHHMRLENGLVWTLPITLPVPKDRSLSFHTGDTVNLMHDGCIYGVMEIEDLYEADTALEALHIFKTTETDHPGVKRLFEQSNLYAGGMVTMIRLPKREVSDKYFLTPSETRKAFNDKGWKNIVAFQTRNPIHRAHEYIQKSALEIVDGLLIHPLVGQTKQDDIKASTRMKSYEAIIKHYYSDQYTMLAAFPAPMRYAGPREAILHALVRKNYGCTHFVVGRDHAGVGNYYGPYDSQIIFQSFSAQELKIAPLFYEHSFYCKKCAGMASVKTCPHKDSDRIILSGTKVREMLKNGDRPPAEFSRPEVIDVLIEEMRGTDE